MTAYAALLRGVNVGGGNAFAMADLKRLCEASGFAKVKTYIASGNVVFTSDESEADVRAKLEQAIAAHLGKSIAVHVRCHADMSDTLARNPFANLSPKFTYVHFLDATPDNAVIGGAMHRTDEDLSPGPRALYVHYPTGMGASKLTLPFAKAATARNLNTVTKLVELTRAL